jgi:hypothetical protein
MPTTYLPVGERTSREGYSVREMCRRLSPVFRWWHGAIPIHISRPHIRRTRPHE